MIMVLSSHVQEQAASTLKTHNINLATMCFKTQRTETPHTFGAVIALRWRLTLHLKFTTMVSLSPAVNRLPLTLSIYFVRTCQSTVNY